MSGWLSPLTSRRKGYKNGSWPSRVSLSHVFCVVVGVVLAWLWMAVISHTVPCMFAGTVNGVHPNGWDQAGMELEGSYSGSSVVHFNYSDGDPRMLINGTSEGLVLQSYQNASRGKELVKREHPRTKLQNIVFGIAGTVAMWEERKEFVRLWWRPGEMRGFVFMDRPEEEDSKCVVQRETESGEDDGGLSVDVEDSQAGSSEEDEGDEKSSVKEVLAAKCQHRNATSKKKSKVDLSFMREKDVTLPELRFSSDTSKYKYTHPTGSRSAIRVARVLVEAFRLLRDDVFWYVMGDDDTVFSPDNLAAVLSKYDPRELYYIGAPSESHLQNVVFSNQMAFGGGGFAISYPLAKLLNDMFDDCLHRYPEVYGSDARIQGCVSELGVQMTLEKGFHQFDLFGNIAGVMEAHPLSPFLSMHHLAVIDPLLPSKSQLASVQELSKTMTKHPLEFLQQTMCLNRDNEWAVSIAWGYSVRWYPYLLRPFELERPQRTFRAWNRGKDAEDFDLDTRNTPVTMCSMPTMFTIAQTGWREDESGNATLLETVYRRAHAVKRSWFGLKRKKKGGKKSKAKGGRKGGARGLLSEGDSRDRRRKLLGLCPLGMKRVPQSSVKTIRVLQPPLGEQWVLKPRRQCCKSLHLVENSTAVEIYLGPCQDGEIIR